MKLGSDFEGSPKELADFCSNHGFDPDRFLKKQHKVPMWVLILFFGLFVGLCITVIFLDANVKVGLALAILALVTLSIGTIATHLKYDRKDVSIAIGVIGFIILAISCGQMDFKYVAERSIDAIK